MIVIRDCFTALRNGGHTVTAAHSQLNFVQKIKQNKQFVLHTYLLWLCPAVVVLNKVIFLLADRKEGSTAIIHFGSNVAAVKV